MPATPKDVLVVDDAREMWGFLEIAYVALNIAFAPGRRTGGSRPASGARSACDRAESHACQDRWNRLAAIIRRITAAPILMLSAKHGVVTRVAELGDDDCLHKPFELTELVARLPILLRRPNFARVDALRFLDIEMDIDKRTVQRGNETTALSSREFDLLAVRAVLVRHLERVFTRRQLIDRVCGTDRDVLPPRAPDVSSGACVQHPYACRS